MVLPALAIFVVFAAAFVVLGLAVNRGAKVQQAIRIGIFERSRLLRIQLDEETGMRGFVATHDRTFLAPYWAGAKDFAPVFQATRVTVVQMIPDALPSLDDERTVHAEWVERVAAPLIETPSRRDANALQLEGKRLMDRFRGDDRVLLSALEQAASSADASSNRLVFGVVAAGFGIGLALLLYLLWAGERDRTLRDEVARQELLVERERQIVDALQLALLPQALPSVEGLTLDAMYR
ncbi:MAG: CHASE3 domain-containing protein, partial [Candidatus Eremiobacteraeota bacterium]|nr:CHASE3 domain-containing protein [Candidatus Eremiobacteraeota bacterium]